MKSLTEQYVEFAVGLRKENIPSDVRERVCELILDVLGVGIAGADSPPATIARKCMEAQTSFKDATLWGGREKSSIYGAAFINGTSAHAYDYDDTHNWAEIHISSILVPCLLALGEKIKISGPKMIEVYTAAYEVMARIGVIGNARILYGKGFHPSGIWGPFGSALATGLIIGLDRPKLVNALGIAGSYSSGLLEFQYDGSMTKRFHPGLASCHGMTAAFLAKEGFTGPSTIIEGKKGCINTFTCDFSKIDLALKGLGEYFEVLETHVKVYACVSGFSASIECLLTIMNNNQIGPEQIEAIDVGVREMTYMWVRPPEEKPKNILSAQMNLAYCLAVAAYEKDVKLAQFSEDRLKDPKILAFMDRIKISPDKELTDLNVGKQDTVILPGRVVVKTKDGRIFKHQLIYAKDSRGNRATRAELRGKFLELSSSIIGVSNARNASEMAYNLENLDDIGKLARLCCIP
jgi:2-methylcitrate dehydratase PrpD